VFVDESGNLGFTKNSTKFFIVAYIECESPIELQTEMKRALKVLHQKKKYHYSDNELKFSHMNQECRKYVLQRISSCDLSIKAIVVEKNTVYTHLRNDGANLYNYLAVNYMVRSMLPQLRCHEKIDITFDKSLSKGKIANFNNYVIDKAQFLLNQKRKRLVPNSIAVSHVNSVSEPCLQATDAIAGAYFQKFENSNDLYVKLIADKARPISYLWR
jgi:hypothetical protein